MLQPSSAFPFDPPGEAAAPAPKPELRAGEKLTAARTRRGLSLEEVSARIRVRKDFLEALETMDMKLLPGRAYALAYLRSYARELGLDVQAIVLQFERESALTREDPQPQLRNPESKPSPQRPWLAALAVCVGLAGFITWRVVSTEERQPAAVTAAAPAREIARLTGQTGPAAAQPVVEIYALQDAWLEARGPEGTIFFSRTLRAGERYRPEVGVGWTLHAKDGGLFEVYVDGVRAGALSKPGAPVLGRGVDGIGARIVAERAGAVR